MTVYRTGQNKKTNVRRHFTMRLYERFGLVLTDVGLSMICNQIKSGKATFLRRQSNRVSIWKVKFGGRKIVVAYDKYRHEPITALYDKGDNPSQYRTHKIERLFEEIEKEEIEKSKGSARD